MRKLLVLSAIVACSMLIAAGPTSARLGAMIAAPTDVIQVARNCPICKGNCFDSFDCSDFCPNQCAGRCKAKFQKALNACLQRCGVCNPAVKKRG
jgi:hypothetical protein